MNDYISPQWSRSALLSIDVQRDFSLPDGALFIPGTPEAISAMERLTKVYRSADLPIVHIVRLYVQDGSNVDLCRRGQIQGGFKMIQPDSDGSQIAQPLLPDKAIRLDAPLLLASGIQSIADNEWVMYKPRWGAFFKTPLEEHLRSLGVTTIVLCGCNFPNCPRTTVYEASERDFRIVFVQDAVSGVYEKGLEELGSIGVTIFTTEECVRAVASST
jgi:nicotinamidase-related amidase